MSKQILIALVIIAVVFLVGLGIYQKSQSQEAINSNLMATTTDLSANSSTSTPEEINMSSSSPTSTESTAAKNGSHLITLETSAGTIQFETYDADAPKAVNNFITLANKGFYNSTIFHRVIKDFMIQGGDPTGTGRGDPGYRFEDELNPNTPSYKAGYQKGVVAMANAGPNTNGSQFFIMLDDVALQHNYTIFGKVVKGQEVVDKIGNAKTTGHPTTQQEAMTWQGPQDRPLEPIKIVKVKVESK